MSLLPPTLIDLPVQLNPDCSTMEFVLGKRPDRPFTFMYVVDTSLDEEDMVALKEGILDSIRLLPPDALVGFITFGKNIKVYEVGLQGVISSYSFHGLKTYKLEEIQSTLGLLPTDLRNKHDDKAQQLNYMGARFIQPASMCEYTLNTILDELVADSWPIPKAHRPLRATGAALNIGLQILKSCFDKTGARLMLFTGGPCTYGPGLIVGDQLKESIRAHHEITNDTAKHLKKATKYYDSMADLATASGHAVDIFIGSYDQVGLYEMASITEKTGGSIVLADAFTTAIFKQSLLKIFNRDAYGDVEFGLNGSLEVKTSSNLTVSGMIGQGVALTHSKDKTKVSDTAVGEGNTTAWKLCTISPHSSYGIYFDIPKDSATTPQQQNFFIQYILYYQHPSNTIRLKVTTIARPVLTLETDSSLSNYFDQEVALVLMGRMAINKLMKDEKNDVMLWLDKTLIDLCVKFAEYSKNDPQSFRLSQKFTLYPQFIFHLRRSNFIQVFNNSPDESLFYRHVFNTEDTTNSLIMIQPTLTAYELNKEPEPVLLDSISIKPDRILLLDTFFHILIYHGETIASWRRQEYQEREGFEHFKALLDAPRQELGDLIYDRFPLPRFIDTEEGGSQARFLYSKLNPTTSYKSTASAIGDAFSGALGMLSNSRAAQPGGAVVLTDDVSLQVFMDHVRQLVVKSAAT